MHLAGFDLECGFDTGGGSKFGGSGKQAECGYHSEFPQGKLRMMGSEQQCPGRMYFCAEEKRIKWMHLFIKGAIKFAHWEVKILHSGGDQLSGTWGITMPFEG